LFELSVDAMLHGQQNHHGDDQRQHRYDESGDNQPLAIALRI